MPESRPFVPLTECMSPDMGPRPQEALGVLSSRLSETADSYQRKIAELTAALALDAEGQNPQEANAGLPEDPEAIKAEHLSPESVYEQLVGLSSTLTGDVSELMKQRTTAGELALDPAGRAALVAIRGDAVYRVYGTRAPIVENAVGRLAPDDAAALRAVMDGATWARIVKEAGTRALGPTSPGISDASARLSDPGIRDAVEAALDSFMLGEIELRAGLLGAESDHFAGTVLPEYLNRHFAGVRAPQGRIIAARYGIDWRPPVADTDQPVAQPVARGNGQIGVGGAESRSILPVLAPQDLGREGSTPPASPERPQPTARAATAAAMIALSGVRPGDLDPLGLNDLLTRGAKNLVYGLGPGGRVGRAAQAYVDGGAVPVDQVAALVAASGSVTTERLEELRAAGYAAAERAMEADNPEAAAQALAVTKRLGNMTVGLDGTGSDSSD